MDLNSIVICLVGGGSWVSSVDDDHRINRILRGRINRSFVRHSISIIQKTSPPPFR